MRVFRKLDMYDPSQSFNNWFSRIIIHSSSDYYRYAKESHVALEDRYETVPDNSLDAIDLLSYQELLSCISDLSPQYRTVFNMYAIDGYKHREIAKLLSISEGTSKSNLSKAKQQLQNIIRERDEVKVQNN